ncbi:MAG: hypothetical protein V4607_08185 [Pseudomonadota bacterium]
MHLQPGERIVKKGTYLYDGSIECDICIVYSPIRYGSGDYGDPPEWGEDQEIDTYYLYFGATTERGRFAAGSGGTPSLTEAMAAAEAAPGVGKTVRWLSGA